MHVEAGGGSGTLCSINDADIRALISKASAVQMSFNQWWGASSSVSLDFRIYGGRGATNTAGNYNAQTGRGYGGYTRCRLSVPGGTQFQLYSGGQGTDVPSNGGRIDYGAPGGGASVARWTSGSVILGIAGGGGGAGGEGYTLMSADGTGGNGGGANSGGNTAVGNNSVYIGGGGGGGSGSTGGSGGASQRGNPGSAGTSGAGGSGKTPLTSYAYGANSLGYNGGYGGNGAPYGDGFGGGGGANAGGGGGGGGGGYGRTSAYSSSSTVTVTGSNGSRNGTGYIYIYIGSTLVKNVTSSGSSANSGTYTA